MRSLSTTGDDWNGFAYVESARTATSTAGLVTRLGGTRSSRVTREVDLFCL